MAEEGEEEEEEEGENGMGKRKRNNDVGNDVASYRVQCNYAIDNANTPTRSDTAEVRFLIGCDLAPL